MRNSTLLNFVILALLIIGCIYLAYALQNHSFQENITTAQTSTQKSPAPHFEFTDIHGKTHKLSDFKGKNIVLNFWASWCGPCAEEFPELLLLAAKRQDITIIALSVDEKPDAITRFLSRYKSTDLQNLLIGQDKGKHIAQDLYQTFRIPETILIAPDLTLGKKYIGMDFDHVSLSADMPK